jgi:hypothetical protein
LVDNDATLWDVIQMAGGLTDKADVANAWSEPTLQ